MVCLVGVATPRNSKLFMAKFLGLKDGFLLHRRVGIADGEALVQILPKECGKAAETFILRGMDQFVSDENTVVCEIASDVDTMAKCKPSGEGTDEPSGLAGCTQDGMLWRGNGWDRQQTNALRMDHANLPSVGNLRSRKANASFKNSLFLLFGPCRRQGQKLLKLFWAQNAFAHGNCVSPSTVEVHWDADEMTPN